MWQIIVMSHAASRKLAMGRSRAPWGCTLPGTLSDAAAGNFARFLL